MIFTKEANLISQHGDVLCVVCLISNFVSRRKLHQANATLSKVLIEMVRCIIATEELIGQKISDRTKMPQSGSNRRSSTGNKDAQESGPLTLHIF